MKSARTALPDEQIAKIEKLGVPIYSFLREAATEKLERIQFVDMLEIRMAEFEKRQKQELQQIKSELQDNMVEAVSVMNTIVSGQIEKDAELKVKFNEALQMILRKIS